MRAASALRQWGVVRSTAAEAVGCWSTVQYFDEQDSLDQLDQFRVNSN